MVMTTHIFSCRSSSSRSTPIASHDDHTVSTLQCGHSRIEEASKGGAVQDSDHWVARANSFTGQDCVLTPEFLLVSRR